MLIPAVVLVEIGPHSLAPPGVAGGARSIVEALVAELEAVGVRPGNAGLGSKGSRRKAGVDPDLAGWKRMVKQ